MKEMAAAPTRGKDDRASLKLDNRLDCLQHGSELYEMARILLLER